MTDASQLGPISGNEERMRDMLAHCVPFQTLCGVFTAAAALTRIYCNSLPIITGLDDSWTAEEIISLRPFAMVSLSDVSGLSDDERSLPIGTLYVVIEDNVKNAGPWDFGAGDRNFKNVIGRIIRSGDFDCPGLRELSLGKQFLDLGEIRLQAIYRNPENDRATFGDFQTAALAIDFGPR